MQFRGVCIRTILTAKGERQISCVCDCLSCVNRGHLLRGSERDRLTSASFFTMFWLLYFDFNRRVEDEPIGNERATIKPLVRVVHALAGRKLTGAQAGACLDLAGDFFVHRHHGVVLIFCHMPRLMTADLRVIRFDLLGDPELISVAPIFAENGELEVMVGTSERTCVSHRHHNIIDVYDDRHRRKRRRRRRRPRRPTRQRRPRRRPRRT